MQKSILLDEQYLYKLLNDLPILPTGKKVRKKNGNFE